MTNPIGTPRGVSDAHEVPLTESPAISLPRFTPSNCIPLSARTVDSGISNEDETRPPTTASLPMDNPLTSPINYENQNRTPHIVEDHEDRAVHSDKEEEHVEKVSAMPSFVPEDGGSSVEEHSSQMSEDALRFRAETKRLEEQAKKLNSLHSVSITPSSYSSNITDPEFYSTPIKNEKPLNQFLYILLVLYRSLL
uniref:Uncharacterized protein n=1 Tax=Caenorhabditis tropicalis TaxID=1561998 RepID=A0A1I7TA34_9PELO